MLIARYLDICRIDVGLRDYQQEAKQAIFEAWDRVSSIMFQMPTGTGKTRLFTSIINDINRYSVATKQPVKIIVIAHRTELIDQIDEHLSRYSIPHGIIAGGTERNLKMPVQVASIQTLTNKHNADAARKLKADFLIIDEAHHSLARTYKSLWRLYPHAKRLGVTATPWRMSGNGFTDLFDDIIMSWPVKKYIEQGYLSDYNYFSLKQTSDISRQIEHIDEFDLEGDYKVSALERTMNTGAIRAQLLDAYLTLANGKKGIIYAISQEHSKKIKEDYEARGIKIATIDSKTPKQERKQIVNDFRRGLITIIVNVDIFSEGFDCPDIEFVQLARPTCSLAKYLQQVGRALRPTAQKSHAIILDNVGMYQRFGLPDARRHWKHHFIGANKSTEEIQQAVLRLGDGAGRVYNLNEGHEDMVLIQQTSDVLKEEESFEIQPRKSLTIGEIHHPSGFVWRDPTYEYKNGVYYYQDVYGHHFCLYPDKNGCWEFDLILNEDTRKVLIKRDFGVVNTVSDFSLICMLARATGKDIMYIGLENDASNDFHLMDFFAPYDYDGTVDSILKNRLYFDREGEHYETADDFYINADLREEDDEEIDEETRPLAAAFARLTANIEGPKRVPNTEPLALLGYSIESTPNAIRIIANMNDNTSETLYEWGPESDFANKIRECDKNGVPYEILGIITPINRKFFPYVWLYTLQPTGDIETEQFLTEDGMYYTEENKLKPEYRPQLKKAGKKKKHKRKKENVAKETQKEEQVVSTETQPKRIRQRIKRSEIVSKRQTE